jgi:hypothetical protein
MKIEKKVKKHRTWKCNYCNHVLRIKAYNALAVPILLYGNEIWAHRRRDKM